MKPFLKWAGNKYQIINRIRELLPAGKRLIEPFAGSCAVFLNTDYSSNLLSDTNADLINTYKFLQTEGQIFIDYCQSFFMPQNNTENTFYELRNQFNSTTDLRLKAALFIYLNKHCYNGLCRYNSKGRFNTPFGKYAKPYFPAHEMLYFSEKSRQAEFISSDFVSTLNSAQKGDVIYCDPPYVPLSNTSNFTSYSKDGFNQGQQIQLAKMAELLAKKGITVIISNHHTDFTEEIYQQASLISFEVQRFISCSGSKRNKVKEMLAIFGV